MAAMTGGRIAALILGAAVCGAWLVSAAGVMRQAPETRTAPRQPEASQFDALATDMQAQAGRLRERLAQAPAPRAGERNPFRFAERPAPSGSRVRRQLATVPQPAPIAPEIREPVLQLIGVAESTSKEGRVRTAMITGGHSELMLVTAGQRIVLGSARYEIVAVGADAVELKDVDTGAVRRLFLQ